MSKQIKVKGAVFERIAAYASAATKTEKKLIESLKTVEPSELIYMSVTELADITDVGEATILRFCRNIDFDGFQDFKLNLSREIGGYDKESAPDKPVFLATEMKDAIENTLNEVDYAYYLEIASKIVSSKRIYISAVGNSAAIASALKIRLLKLGLAAEHSPDSHVQAFAAANMTPDDFLIVVSVSGSTKDVLSVAETAKMNGVPVAAITNHFKSPLAHFSDYLLYSCRKENPAAAGNFATLASQLYVTDVLSDAVREELAGVAEKRGEKASKAVVDKLV